MRMRLVLAIVLGGLVSAIGAQSPAPSPAGPVFDVVSIKPSAPFQTGGFRGPTFNERPDGGFTMTHVAVGLLVMRAYPIPGAALSDIVGLPEWTAKELFDVSTTSSLTRATREDRTAMMRAMLADRFKLVAHVEQRPQQTFELVMARGDRRLGNGLTPIEADCDAQTAARRAEVQAAINEGRQPNFPRTDSSKPPGPCELRSVTGRPTFKENGAPVVPATRFEGEGTLAGMLVLLRAAVGRPIVDRAGLTGSYRIAVEFDLMASRRGPDVAPAADGGPTIFTAVQEQLGLKLQSVTAVRDTLIVDRLERPTEN